MEKRSRQFHEKVRKGYLALADLLSRPTFCPAEDTGKKEG